MDKPFYFRYLARLHRSMQRQKKDIEQVVVSYNNVQFDYIFDMGCEPFEFMIGAVGKNFARVYRIFYNQEKAEYYCCMPYADYLELRKILNLNPNSSEPFSSSKFLCYIDKHLPAKASSGMINPAVLLPFRENRMSKANRQEGFIFLRWLRHEGCNNGHVTAQNLEKTRLLLGAGIGEYCAKHDISSQWTTDPEKAGELTDPRR